MNTEKPIIFFSHCSKDKASLIRLKSLFAEKTGRSIEIFLSSDGQSIPMGRNWVHKIQEALESASLMVVFVTPNSLRTNWLYFESGYSYAKQVRVVPVGFLGVDLSGFTPPLSLLQGFNIDSEEGLNNLIALANEVFGHSHPRSFTDSEYREICGPSAAPLTQNLGDFGSLVDDLFIGLDEGDELDDNAASSLAKVAEMLQDQDIPFARAEHSITCYGISLNVSTGRIPARFSIRVDPSIIDDSLPWVVSIVRAIRNQGLSELPIRFDFLPSVDFIENTHKLTGRLYGTGAEFVDKDRFVYRDLEFSVDRKFSISGIAGSPRIDPGGVYVTVRPKSDHISFDHIRSLLDLLFSREILYIR